MGGNGSGAMLSRPVENLKAIIDASQLWPSLQASQMLEETVEKPLVMLDHDVLTYLDQRSIMHLNIKGFMVNSEALQSMEIKIWAGDQLMVTTQAVIFDDIWNASWPFAPGNPPEDGIYTLEFLMKDRSGEINTSRQSIEVRLAP
jgi:hypothetical protein